VEQLQSEPTAKGALECILKSPYFNPTYLKSKGGSEGSGASDSTGDHIRATWFSLAPKDKENIRAFLIDNIIGKLPERELVERLWDRIERLRVLPVWPRHTQIGGGDSVYGTLYVDDEDSGSTGEGRVGDVLCIPPIGLEDKYLGPLFVKVHRDSERQVFYCCCIYIFI